MLINLILSLSAASHSGFIQAQESRFNQLKDTIFSLPYSKLPHYRVNKKLFGRSSHQGESKLLSDARRTLNDNSDLLPEGRGQKLLQANGICFVGEWHIEQENPFTGLFTAGSKIPVIARASTTFSGTQQDERRALGLAIKLLPHDLAKTDSLNVFVLHSAGGVTQKHLLDLSMDNEPPLGRIPRFRDISTALKLKSTLLKADKEAGSQKPSVTYRTVAPLAAYHERNLEEPTTVSAPRWIRFSPLTQERIARDDFRDELRVENYPQGKLLYHIEVGHHASHEKSKARWQTIGRLVFTESVTSMACDTRLHFAHPIN